MTGPQDGTLRFSRRRLLAGALGLVGIAGRVLPAIAQPRVKETPMLDMERFIADCVEARRESRAQEAVREVLARGVSDPRAMLAAAGEPTRAGLTVLHRSGTLTIFAAAWTPQLNLMPHNHRMWALIGIYTGREDNILWRRGEGRLEAHGATCLFEGDVASLPDTAIHSVTNPLERFTGGIHIYGGDFFATPRSQWNAETLAEEPSDGEVIRKVFDHANERMLRACES